MRKTVKENFNRQDAKTPRRQEVENMTYETYAFLGTSISQGYYDETAKGWFIRLFEKLNADKPSSYYYSHLARAGDRSFNYWHRLCAEAIQRDTDNLIIEVPCNDLVRHRSWDNQTDLSTDMQMELWGQIVNVAKKNFNKIFVTSGLPKNEKTMAKTRTPDWDLWYKNEDIQDYNKRVMALCDENDIQFIHLYPELDNDDYLNTLDDSVHPNTKGHIMIAGLAYKKFKEIGF